jgi:hypothetical protein
MKRAMPWSDEEEDSSSDESSSSLSNSGAEDGVSKSKAKDQSKASLPSKEKTSKGIHDSSSRCLTKTEYRSQYTL